MFMIVSGNRHMGKIRAKETYLNHGSFKTRILFDYNPLTRATKRDRRDQGILSGEQKKKALSLARGR